MNTLYQNQYGKEALQLINRAAGVAVNQSLALWEQQIDYVRKNADRNLPQLFSLPAFNSPEELFAFQKKVGEAELAELKEAGESCYEIAESAGRELMSVASEGQRLVERSLSEAGEKGAEVFPNGSAAFFSDVVQNSVKSASDFFQKGVSAAAQVKHPAAVNGAAKKQKAVSGAKRKNGK